MFYQRGATSIFSVPDEAEQKEVAGLVPVCNVLDAPS